MDKKLKQAINEAQHALYEMSVAWEIMGNDDELNRAYIECMPYLPDFDEFLWNFMEFSERADSIK